MFCIPPSSVSMVHPSHLLLRTNVFIRNFVCWVPPYLYFLLFKVTKKDEYNRLTPDVLKVGDLSSDT